MKEDKEHIDKLFKESLEQRTFDIPDAFMNDLNARLDAAQNKKKMRFLFFLFGSALLVIGIVLAALFVSKNQSAPSIHPQQTAANDQWAIPQSEEKQAGNNPEQIPGKNQSKTIESNAHDANTPIRDTGNTHQSAAQANRSMKSGQTIKTETGKKTSRQIPQNKQSKTSQTKKVTTQKKKNPLKQTGNKPGKTQTGSGLKSASSKGIGEMGTQKSGEKNVPDPGMVNPGKNAEETAKNEEQPKTSSQEDQPALAAKDSTNAADSISAVAPPGENPGTEVRNNTKKWRYEVQLYAGAGANFIHDSKTAQPNVSKQTSILAPAFGVNGNASFNKFNFGLGLSYSQTGEKYNLKTYSHFIKDSTYSEIITDTVWVFDSITGWTPQLHDSTIYLTGQFPDSTSQDNAIKNNYSWFSVPVSFGYRFEVGNYEFIPRLGLQFNIGLGKNNGRYPAQNLQGVETYQAVRFNMSYLIQLEARRNFNNWHMFVNPYFKSMLSPAISGDVVRRRYSSWGIQFGVGFKL